MAAGVIVTDIVPIGVPADVEDGSPVSDPVAVGIVAVLSAALAPKNDADAE